MVLQGRLGLETARIPHADRHGLFWLTQGNLHVEDGTLRFLAVSSPHMDTGDYAIPFQTVSVILLGPGTTVSHDALRLMARHGTGLVATGMDGVRVYTSPPLMPNSSRVARLQAIAWADADGARMHVARRMFGWRMGELRTEQEIEVLRGIEGARMKETYRLVAQRFGIQWGGRRYDRNNPGTNDGPNDAINHAASAVEAAAMVAVAATATLPQLGFIHEDSSNSFVLDIADLFRDTVTLPVAFEAVKKHRNDPNTTMDRLVRRIAGRVFREVALIPAMIDRIKELFDADDRRGDP